jgi:hypothetical protein
MANLQIIIDAIDNTGQALGNVAGGLTSIIPASALAGAAVATAFAGIAVAATTAAFQIGETFDAAFDSLRVATGATGDAMVGLQDSFKNVFATVPDDAGKVSAAMATLAQRTGETGKPLEELTKSVLDFQRLDPTNNVADLTRAFEQWNIASEDQVATMDKLLRAGQATGIGAGQLEAALVKNRVALQGLGLDFDHTTALIATFEKAGVNSQQALSGLGKAFANFSKDGLDAKEAFAGWVTAIREGEDPTIAIKQAVDLFGVKAGPELAAAIREGRVSIDELAATIADTSGDTIAKATTATEDFAESWGKFKNSVMVALEPVSSAVFGLAATIFDKLTPALTSLTTALAPASTALGALLGLFTEGDPEKRIVFFNQLASVVGGDMAEKIALITSGIVGIVDVLSGNADGVSRMGNALDGLFGEGTAAKVGAIVAPIQQFVTMLSGMMDTLSSTLGVTIDWSGALTGVAVILGATIVSAVAAATVSFLAIKAVILAVQIAFKEFSVFGEAAVKTVTLGVTELHTAFENVLTFFKTVDFGKLVEEWKNQLINGLNGMKDAAAEKLQGIANLFPHSPAKEGPLSVPIDWSYLYAGMDDAMIAAIGTTKAALADLTGGLQAGYKPNFATGRGGAIGGAAGPMGAGVGYSVYDVSATGSVTAAGGTNVRGSVTVQGGIHITVPPGEGLGGLNETDLQSLGQRLATHTLKAMNDAYEATT